MNIFEDFISNLTSEKVAFISVLVTILLYLLGKRSELKLKKHELKKDKYMQFIEILKQSYLKNGEIKMDDCIRERFFDFGSTILVYGSRKMYKKYCFFRESSSDYLKKTKFYYSGLSLFLVADLLNQIRKEVGLNEFELELGYDSISFYTNEIFFNPYSSLNWYKGKISVFLIKFELFLTKMITLVPIKIVFMFLMLPFKMIFLILRVTNFIIVGKIAIKIRDRMKKIKLKRQNKKNSKNIRRRDYSQKKNKIKRKKL